MKSTNHRPAETLKKSIDSVSQRSKESIKTLVETSTKQFDSAIEANKKTFDSLSKMLYDKEMDTTILTTFKTNFGKSVKLSETTLDAIIDAFTKRIDFNIDFVNKFMEMIRSENLNTKEGTEALMELVKETLDKSSALSTENMEKMVALYNEHLNFALNFNKKFADNMNSQVAAMF
ncbi:MAG TPA: hypothetical protein VNY36_09525, partial [Bacteroidia bacterium]|nr:hypothetical protein [Bacteroidia bacterium]